MALGSRARVVEAGAGEGMLTTALAERAGDVVAVERDRAAWERLCARFAGSDVVRPVLGDVLSMRFPREAFVLVGNVPFGITSELMRLALFGERRPVAAYFVLERDAALHWAGAGRSSVMSVLARAGWELDIRMALRRGDFVPRPGTDCVLLAARRRERPLVDACLWERFEAFVRAGFGRGRGDVRRNLRGKVGYRALKRAAATGGFSIDARPSELSNEQWVALFLGTHGPHKVGARGRA